MGPRADFVCLSKPCTTPEGHPTYELPVSATRCPVCGSKRISRLWNAVNVNTGHAKQVDRLAEGPITAAVGKRDELKQARHGYPMVRPVPMRQLGAALQQVYAQNGAPPSVTVNQNDLGRKADLGGSLPATLGEIQGQRMPRQIAAVDREYKVVKGKTGAEIAKA